MRLRFERYFSQRNVASLNIVVYDVINLYYEQWTENESIFTYTYPHVWIKYKKWSQKVLTLDGDGFFIGFAFSGQNKAIFKNLNHYLRSKE